MKETYYSDDLFVSGVIAEFPGTVALTSNANKGADLELSEGLRILNPKSSLAIEYRKTQEKFGFSGQNQSLLALEYDKGFKVEFFDDPLLCFQAFGLASSLEMRIKVLPCAFTYIDISNQVELFRPYNTLSPDDYRQLCFGRNNVAKSKIKKIDERFKLIFPLLAKASNSKLYDGLDYYLDYLKATDPKIELLLLTMILEVLYDT